jgi:hypothetical protein
VQVFRNERLPHFDFEVAHLQLRPDSQTPEYLHDTTQSMFQRYCPMAHQRRCRFREFYKLAVIFKMIENTR